MKHGTSAKTEKLYSVDVLMTKLSLALVRDFQSSLSDPCYAANLQTALRTGDIQGIRKEASALTLGGSVAEFKATYQLQSVLKRYRYQNDIYSDDELRQNAIRGFLETQNRLANLDLNSLSALDKGVLARAAGYVAKILGKYDDEEHRHLCRFGSGASVGVPARLASLASRWELPMSGSREQISWFDSEMSQVDSVMKYWQKQKDSDPEKRSVYHEVDSLTLVLVPKTFKSLRVIMPNTTIGSYMSYGLGEMIRRRLKRAGYDIRDLQMRHRYYAQQGSVHGLYTTADLSSASDSITVELVERLLPSDWVKILNQSRIDKVRMPDGSEIVSKTYCTMGIGYTFPLQTLVFLCLLKAIEASYYAKNNKRLISVYGDDMVYSSRMHDKVVLHFSAVGFVINLDKTFHEGNFRESCGGDYYHGVDVRPFQPRSGPVSVGKKAYEAILYKCINGLLMRWSEYEIGNTLNMLTSEIENIAGACKIVPSDYPDDSGVKCSFPIAYEFLRIAKYAKPKHIGHGVFRFSYLRLVSKEREEMRHEPYLWNALRGITSPPAAYGSGNNYQEVQTQTVRRINGLVGLNGYEPLLSWKEASPIQTIRSKISGRRLRRLVSTVTISHSGTYKRQSGISCFETRS